MSEDNDVVALQRAFHICFFPQNDALFRRYVAFHFSVDPHYAIPMDVSIENHVVTHDGGDRQGIQF
ncbi:MAG: hypothetical protein VB074_15945 [Proteiniphilum sp.]|nr:hypothetical protein [Proteiniphilum sp.]MEA5129671.1 hypothetical protein [Proteiniphilum sp.]